MAGKRVRVGVLWCWCAQNFMAQKRAERMRAMREAKDAAGAAQQRPLCHRKQTSEAARLVRSTVVSVCVCMRVCVCVCVFACVCVRVCVCACARV